MIWSMLFVCDLQMFFVCFPSIFITGWFFFIYIFFCQQTPETEAHSILLLTAMCIPYIFNFLSSCWKVHFGNEKPPSILTVVLVSISLFQCEYKKIGKTNCYCPFSRQLKSMFKFSVMHVHIKLFDMSYNRQ